MFYQNSNDLVKQNKNSSNSNYVDSTMNQNSSSNVGNGRELDVNNDGLSSGLDAVGRQFNNFINSIVDYTKSTMIEGIDGSNTSSVATIRNPGDTPVSDAGSLDATLQQIKSRDSEYATEQAVNRSKLDAVVSLLAAEDRQTRNNWVQVIDSNGISKYGYITKDNIFQIWYFPGDAKNNPQNWFATEPIKYNTDVLGCPKPTASINTITISDSWDTIQPFTPVFEKNDNKRSNPVFMLSDDSVRDIKRSAGQDGLFSCGNERTNIVVKERPSADFEFGNGSDSIKTGCYTIIDGVTMQTFTDRGFEFQHDLTDKINTSISKCKRRAEDLGSRYFFLADGYCVVYTGKGEPNINGLLTLDETAQTCKKFDAPQADEDAFMKAYTTDQLPRMVGRRKDVNIPANPANPTCNHRMKNGCIFKDYIDYGNATCYPPNRDGYWVYGGLYDLTNDQLKGWLSHLNNRNGGGQERPAVQEYINRCKNTDGYEFLDDSGKKNTKTLYGAALYSLKSSGTTGVDMTDPGKPGLVGKIAYIDHNGQRHEYPRSLLSSADGANGGGDDTFMEIGNYDTRGNNDTYGIKGVGDTGIDGISFEECKKRCAADKSSGGFVYVGTKTSTSGKCMLKDKAKMFPVGLRQSDPSKILMLKVPTINKSVKDDSCSRAGPIYTGVDSTQYLHYPDGGNMTANTICDITSMVPQSNTVKPADVTSLVNLVGKTLSDTQKQISDFSGKISEGFFTLREGATMETGTDISNSNYGRNISGVDVSIKRLGNASQQLERINAFKDESNLLLISQSYKFIVWGVLAILAVMALLKIKEMYGQDNDEDDEEGFFGALSALGTTIGLTDINDKTDDVKNAMSEAGDQIKQTTEDAVAGINDGANKAVATLSQTANTAVEGVTNVTDKMSVGIRDAIQGAEMKTGGKRFRK